MSEAGSISLLPRDLIASNANLSLTVDYVTSFSGQVSRSDNSDATSINIVVRYVPDKLVMDMNSLPDYLQAMRAYADETLERLAGVILDDMNNELVPRWLHVTASVGDHPDSVRHSVTFEDRQPNWENPTLLARLSAI